MGNSFTALYNDCNGSIYRLQNKQLSMNNMNETIILADMEIDGIYFSEQIKEQLEKQREELYCEYSGLPSVKAYEN